MPTLTADRITVQMNGKALLRDVSLTVSGGEIVAIVGPNGAGKSTLLAALAGDLPLTAGDVRLDNAPIASMRPRELALRRAVLPQQTIIQFAFTAREVVEMGRSPWRDGGRTGRHGHNGHHGQNGHHGAPPSARSEADIVQRVLEQVDIASLAGRSYPSLSVGEQARVSLARVLAQGTDILLLDEPTAALDLRHQQLVMVIARALAADGAAIAVVLHDLNLAAAWTDRIVLLQDGRLIADGPPAAVLTEPLLRRVFDCDVTVTTHPIHGCPLILPLVGARNEERGTGNESELQLLEPPRMGSREAV